MAAIKWLTKKRVYYMFVPLINRKRFKNIN